MKSVSHKKDHTKNEVSHIIQQLLTIVCQKNENRVSPNQNTNALRYAR